MEITSVNTNFSTAQGSMNQNITRNRVPAKIKSPKVVAPTHKVTNQAEDLDKLHRKISAAMDEIQKLGEKFNRKLKFSVNKDINQVVVKVIDANTDKVIREIPAEEVQNLQTRMRETFGLLFDEEA